MKRILLFILLLAALPAGAQQLKVKEFPGPDVATKLTNAQNACHATLPCVLVLEPELAAYTEGTLPTRCATCTWLDYRTAGQLKTTGITDSGTITSKFLSVGETNTGNTASLTVNGSGGIGALLDFRTTGVDGYNQIDFYPENGSVQDAEILAHKCASGTGPSCTGLNLHRHLSFYTSPSLGGAPENRLSIDYGVADAEWLFSRSHINFDTTASPAAGGGYLSQAVLQNNGFLKSWNVANTQVPNLIGLNGGDTVEVGASTSINKVSIFGGSSASVDIASGHINQASASQFAGTQPLIAGAATVTFPAAYTSAPVCTCTDQTAAAAVKCSTSTTTLTIAGTSTDSIAYACFGNPN